MSDYLAEPSKRPLLEALQPINKPANFSNHFVATFVVTKADIFEETSGEFFFGET